MFNNPYLECPSCKVLAYCTRSLASIPVTSGIYTITVSLQRDGKPVIVSPHSDIFLFRRSKRGLSFSFRIPDIKHRRRASAKIQSYRRTDEYLFITEFIRFPFIYYVIYTIYLFCRL